MNGFAEYKAGILQEFAGKKHEDAVKLALKRMNGEVSRLQLWAEENEVGDAVVKALKDLNNYADKRVFVFPQVAGWHAGRLYDMGDVFSHLPTSREEIGLRYAISALCTVLSSFEQRDSDSLADAVIEAERARAYFNGK